jgi:hypothetical protein
MVMADSKITLLTTIQGWTFILPLVLTLLMLGASLLLVPWVLGASGPKAQKLTEMVRGVGLAAALGLIFFFVLQRIAEFG